MKSPGLSLELPNAVSKRLEAMGEPGRQWLTALPERVAELSERWSLTRGNVLHGGSEALVIEVKKSSGESAILKVLVPQIAEPGQSASLKNNELCVLRAAGGRGYVDVLSADEELGAWLMPQLGSPLGVCETDPAIQQRILCETLSASWMTPAENLGLQTGAEKAVWLRRFINRLAHDHPGAISDQTREIAIAFTHLREEAHPNATKVLVHGDAHEFNALLESQDSYRLIDPDGLCAEAEYDMGILMREASEELLVDSPKMQAAPIDRGYARCERLATLSGTQTKAIWQWGFVERVSTGLYTLALNMPEYSKPSLAVANSWATQGAQDAFS